MSWFARSIANSLKLDDEDGDDVSNTDHNQAQKKGSSNAEEQNVDPSSPTSPSRGVKEDISELTKTFTRQFWGVASFLAPAPQAEPEKFPRGSDLTESYEKSELISDSEDSEQVGIGGIRSDFAEIGGRFRSGISKLSSNIAVSEFTKIASNLLQLGSDNEEEKDEGGLGRGAIGVTEEVVAFARDISMHPGTWLDFPLPEDEDDDSFELSDVQQEHALAVEHFVPFLSSLRIELCPGYMSESLFWKIYFVLLHPQLNEQDAALLSTPEVLETRALLSHKLPSRTTTKPQELSETAIEDDSSQNMQLQSIPKDENVSTEKPEASASALASTDGPETEKHTVESSEIQIVDKSMIEEEKRVDHGDLQVEDDYDDWLKEEEGEGSSEHVGPTHASSSMLTVKNEDDVSFSDLEEDEDVDNDGKMHPKARDWVELNKSSSKKVTASDWLDVDVDVDFDDS